MTHRTDGTVRSMTEAEFEARVQELMKAEEDNPMAHWFLSYADPPNPWSGCIIEAPGFTHACVYAGISGCRGRGEIMGVKIPADQVPAQEFHHKLLTRDECEKFWGEMKTIAEWDQISGVSGYKEPDFKRDVLTEDGTITWKNLSKPDEQKH